MKNLRQLVRWGIALLAGLLEACHSVSQDAPLLHSQIPDRTSVPVYRLAVHPLYNPHFLAATYQPRVDHPNTQWPLAQLALEASRDYTSFEKKYTQREPAFLPPNPRQTLQGLSQRAPHQEAAQLRGIWETEPLANNSVMMRDDVVARHVKDVEQAVRPIKSL